MLGVLDAMSTCLERGGCAVVPGLPSNQYQLTLITSLVGGVVFGFSTTIPPQGTLRRLNYDLDETIETKAVRRQHQTSFRIVPGHHIFPAPLSPTTSGINVPEIHSQSFGTNLRHTAFSSTTL